MLSIFTTRFYYFQLSVNSKHDVRDHVFSILKSFKKIRLSGLKLYFKLRSINLVQVFKILEG